MSLAPTPSGAPTSSTIPVVSRSGEKGQNSRRRPAGGGRSARVPQQVGTAGADQGNNSSWAHAQTPTLKHSRSSEQIKQGHVPTSCGTPNGRVGRLVARVDDIHDQGPAEHGRGDQRPADRRPGHRVVVVACVVAPQKTRRPRSWSLRPNHPPANRSQDAITDRIARFDA